MAPTHSLLHLIKLHLFLLPFTDTHLLLTDLENFLLSLSSGSQTRLHTEISLASLTSCQKASSFYLCEQKCILQYELKYTCLGSLCTQDYVAALELCPYNIIPHQELVLQVQA